MLLSLRPIFLKTADVFVSFQIDLDNKRIYPMGKGRPERGGFQGARFQQRSRSCTSEEKYHININTRSDFKAQRKKCEDIINGGVPQIFMHCFGNAINCGINLALDLVNNSNGALKYEINTSTIRFIDENDTPFDCDELKCEQRYNSAVHIRIFREKFPEKSLEA